jgi:HD-GYP domain-containing protein (c-di-GMP phosphodiesterase class II)
MAMYFAKSSGKNRVETWENAKRRDAEAASYANGRSPRCDLVASLRDALNAKDDETRRRAEECARYATELAPELGLSAADVAGLRQAVTASGGHGPDT